MMFKNKVKAIILDLDNTVYPVSSIGNKLFDPLFKLIEDNGNYKGNLEEIKTEIQRKPFHFVAEKYGFEKPLIDESISLLKELTYNDRMETYPDYSVIQKLKADKYLVTSGFTKLQRSKVNQLGIQHDFKEIHIIDNLVSDDTKKTIFFDIIERNGYDLNEVLVIGDDLESEIQAAIELGVHYLLYDRNGYYNMLDNSIPKISDFEDVPNLLQ